MQKCIKCFLLTTGSIFIGNFVNVVMYSGLWKPGDLYVSKFTRSWKVSIEYNYIELVSQITDLMRSLITQAVTEEERKKESAWLCQITESNFDIDQLFSKTIQSRY